MWHKNLRIVAGRDRNAVAPRYGGSRARDVANHNSTCDVQEIFVLTEPYCRAKPLAV
jgi:hypothetical protein